MTVDEPTKWITDPIEKYGDVRPPADRMKPRHLPTSRVTYRQTDPTAELALRREAEERFRIKRTSE